MLQRIENWLEVPMLVLGLVWLVLIVAEFIWGISPTLDALSTTIWILFIVHFLIEIAVAPDKSTYLRRNWLTAFSLLLPALRVFRLFRVLRILRVSRAARGLRLVRLVTSVNRGMRSLGGSMRRRGLGYAVALTALVVLSGAAGMYAFENGVPGGLDSYGEALWWTAMLITSIGSEYWPQSPEGRVLCFVLSLYGFAVFGYFTAALASFFVGQDAASDEADLPSAAAVESLRADLAALGAEIRSLRNSGSGEAG